MLTPISGSPVRSVLRKVVALLLALLPIESGAMTIVAIEKAAPFGPGAEHACCRRYCPPKQAHHDCHGEASAGPLFQPAGCHHGEEGASPVAAIRPHLMPDETVVDPGYRAQEQPAVADSTGAPGYLEIVVPPPRPHS